MLPASHVKPCPPPGAACASARVSAPTGDVLPSLLYTPDSRACMLLLASAWCALMSARFLGHAGRSMHPYIEPLTTPPSPRTIPSEVSFTWP
jgi:hypothetical protein